MWADGDVAALADDLAREWGQPKDDPFEPDLVVVPSPGLGRWLAQSLARCWGVCAGVEFRSISWLERQVAACPTPDELAAAIASAVAASAEGEFGPLKRHLAASSRRHQVLGRLAGLFARYAEYRPEMVQSWRAASEGEEWQAALWRATVAQLGGVDLCERYDMAVRRVDDEPDAVPFGRVAVFAPPLVTPEDVDVAQSDGSADPGLDAVEYSPRRMALARALGRHRRLDWCLLLGAAGLRPSVELEVHLSHGLDRQVEVAREVLTGLFEDDPSLEPRDVVVLTPSVSQAAGFVKAAFLTPQTGHPANQLRVQVAGLSSLEANPLAGFMLRLLAAPQSRMTVRDFVDILGFGPVAARFGIAEVDRRRIAELAAAANVKWGLNSAHRGGFSLASVPQDTWLFGLQRMLLGVALSGDELAFAKTALPVDDVESSDVRLLGAVSECFGRLVRALESFREPASLPQWRTRLQEALSSLCDAPGADLADALAVFADDSPAGWFGTPTHGPQGVPQPGGEQARPDAADRQSAGAATAATTADIGDEAGEAGDGPQAVLLTRREVASLLESRLASRRTRPVFGNGSLLVAEPDQLRHVPHRVVLLLGWDAERFGRPARPDGDDLMAADPRPGDPDPVEESRRLLRDAARSATRRLVVVAQGHSPLTNLEVALPAPLADLIEEAGRSGRSRPVRRHHPLHGFSPAAFADSAECPPLSRDEPSLEGARALLTSRGAPARDPYRVELPPPQGDDPVDLDDLVSFFANPARHLLRMRGGFTLGGGEESTSLPIEPDALQRWSMGRRCLDWRLAGMPAQRVAEALWRSGEVPPGRLGQRAIEGVLADVEGVIQRLPRDHDLPPRPLAVELPGLVGQVALRGDSLVFTEFSKLQRRHRLAAWIKLLAAAASRPGETTRAFTAAKNRLHALSAPADPFGPLSDLLALYHFGMARALPAAPRVNEYWANLRAQGEDPQSPDAKSRLKQLWQYDSDANWEAFFDLDTLLSAPAGDFPIGPTREESLQGRVALAIWQPLLDAEVAP
jgi:exodeoxyribonuclease V gamma subunit